MCCMDVPRAMRARTRIMSESTALHLAHLPHLRGIRGRHLLRIRGAADFGFLHAVATLAQRDARVRLCACAAPHSATRVVDFDLWLEDAHVDASPIVVLTDAVASARGRFAAIRASVQVRERAAAPAPSQARQGEVELRVDDGYAVANALRRALLDSIPSWAISYATVAQNGTAVTDEELVAHLSLVPVCCDRDDDGVQSTAALTLDVAGADERGGAPQWVTSSSLVSVDSGVRVLRDDLPLFLLPAQARVTAKLFLFRACGADSAAHSPITAAGYAERLRVSLNDEQVAMMPPARRAEMARRCGADVLRYDADAQTLRVSAPDGCVSASREAMLSGVERSLRPAPDAPALLLLAPDPSAITLRFETDGRMGAADAWRAALGALERMCDGLHAALRRDIPRMAKEFLDLSEEEGTVRPHPARTAYERAQKSTA